MMERAGCDAGNVSPDKMSCASELQRDKLELKAYYDDMTKLEKLAISQDDFIASPTNEDDFCSQLDKINDQIEGVTSPSRMQEEGDSENLPAKAAATHVARTRQAPSPNVSRNHSYRSYKQTHQPPLISNDPSKESNGDFTFKTPQHRSNQSRIDTLRSELKALSMNEPKLDMALTRESRLQSTERHRRLMASTVASSNSKQVLKV